MRSSSVFFADFALTASAVVAPRVGRMAGLDTLLLGLDAGQRVRGRGFERLCRWVLENAPEYAAKVDTVWLWEEWPGRGGRLTQASTWSPRIARAACGRCRRSTTTLPTRSRRRTLTRSCAESSRAEFSYRLLIATTDHLGPTARRTLEGQEKPVGMLLRSDLAALDLDLASLAGGAASREAETEAASSAPAQRVKRHRQGTWRRRTAARWLWRAVPARRSSARSCTTSSGRERTLVLVPSLSLLEQTCGSGWPSSRSTTSPSAPTRPSPRTSTTL